MADELPVPPRLRRTAQSTEEDWLASAVALLQLVADELGVVDLGGVRLLDMGCGTKFTKVILEQEIPIGRYVGIDTSDDVIGHLREHVSDPRFEFHHIDVHNDLYNPGGVPLDQLAGLPVADGSVDGICLFSVFTHLSPTDYRAMLRLLRPCVAPGGRLVYSVLINQPGPAEEAQARLHDELRRRLADAGPDVTAALEAEVEARLRSGDPEVAAAAEQTLRDRVRRVEGGGDDAEVTADDFVPDFVDVRPDQPLMYAAYSRRHAFELIEGTGWQPLVLRPPTPFVQHCFVCAPV
jgi:SAM-dependent methyltransferase